MMQYPEDNACCLCLGDESLALLRPYLFRFRAGKRRLRCHIPGLQKRGEKACWGLRYGTSQYRSTLIN